VETVSVRPHRPLALGVLVVAGVVAALLATGTPVPVLVTTVLVSTLVGVVAAATHPRLVCGLALAAFLVVLPLQLLVPALGRIDEILTLLAVIAAAIRVVSMRRIRFGSLVVAAAVFVLAQGVSSALGGVGAAGFAASTFLFVKGPLLGWAFAQFDWDEAALTRLFRGTEIVVWTLVAGLLAQAAFEPAWSSLLQRTLPPLRLGLPVATSYMPNPGDLAVLSAVAVAVVAARACVVRLARREIAVAAAAALMLVATLRRKDLVAVAFALAVLLWWRRRSSRVPSGPRAPRRLLLFGGLVSALLATPLAFALVRYTWLEYLSGTRVVPRFLLYRDGVLLAVDHFPFGAGSGLFASHYSVIERSPLYERLGYDEVWGFNAENDSFLTDTFWPAVVGEGGVVALLAYLGLVVLPFVWARRLLRTADTSNRILALATIASGVVLLVNSLAAPTFAAPPTAPLLFVLAGLCVSRLRGASSESVVRAGPRRATTEARRARR